MGFSLMSAAASRWHLDIESGLLLKRFGDVTAGSWCRVTELRAKHGERNWGTESDDRGFSPIAARPALDKSVSALGDGAVAACAQLSFSRGF